MSRPGLELVQPAKENDCMHRFRYAARYLLFFDPDEFLHMRPPLHNISDLFRFWEKDPGYNASASLRWRNEWHTTALEGAPASAATPTTVRDLAEGRMGALVSRMPLRKASGPDFHSRHKYAMRPERAHVAETHRLFEGDLNATNIDIHPDAMHHDHYHRINEGFFGVTDGWETVEDVAWASHYGRAFEEAVQKLAQNLTASE